MRLWNILVIFHRAVVEEAWLYVLQVSFEIWQSDMCLTVFHHMARAHEGYSLRPPYKLLTTVVWLRFKQLEPHICQISKDFASEVIRPGSVELILYGACSYHSRNFLLRGVVCEGGMTISWCLIELGMYGSSSQIFWGASPSLNWKKGSSFFSGTYNPLDCITPWRCRAGAWGGYNDGCQYGSGTESSPFTYSFNTSRTPRSRASTEPASFTAWDRFKGASALIAVQGLIAPVTTTGFWVFTVRSRKHAVSSSVSIPCVTTEPWDSGFAMSALMNRVRSSRIVELIDPLSIFETCRPETFEISHNSGTASRSAWMVTPTL
jgi:hypothetical protein